LKKKCYEKKWLFSLFGSEYEIGLTDHLDMDEIKPFSLSLFIKLIIAPLIAFGVAKLFGWDNEASHVSILEASMAPMITAGALASMTGLAPRLSSAIVGYGILFSFFTSYAVFVLL
jgi:hypothetical protein